MLHPACMALYLQSDKYGDMLSSCVEGDLCIIHVETVRSKYACHSSLHLVCNFQGEEIAQAAAASKVDATAKKPTPAPRPMHDLPIAAPEPVPAPVPAHLPATTVTASREAAPLAVSMPAAKAMVTPVDDSRMRPRPSEEPMREPSLTFADVEHNPSQMHQSNHDQELEHQPSREREHKGKRRKRERGDQLVEDDAHHASPNVGREQTETVDDARRTEPALALDEWVAPSQGMWDDEVLRGRSEEKFDLRNVLRRKRAEASATGSAGSGDDGARADRRTRARPSYGSVYQAGRKGR